jgi:hypothetical protein
MYSEIIHIHSEIIHIHSEIFYFSNPYPISVSASEFSLIRSRRSVFGALAESGKIFLGKQLTPFLQGVAIALNPKT